MCQSILYRTERRCKTSNQADRQKKESRDFDVSYCKGHKHNRFVKVWLIKLNPPEDDAALLQQFNLFCVSSRLLLFASHIDPWQLEPEFEKYRKRCKRSNCSIMETPYKHFLAKEISCYGVIMDQFPHTVTCVTSENAWDKRYRLVFWCCISFL